MKKHVFFPLLFEFEIEILRVKKPFTVPLKWSREHC